MNKLFRRLKSLPVSLKKTAKGYEENIFLILGILIAVGVPVLVLLNPIKLPSSQPKARSVLQAIEIPNPDDDDDNGGGGGGNPNPVPNGTPNLVPDYKFVPIGQTVSIPVLDNDTPRNNVPLNRGSLAINRQPTRGTVRVLPNGEIEFIPNADFGTTKEETDTFEYRVTSQNGQTASTYVVVHSYTQGMPALAVDNVSTPEDTPVTFPVLNNDTGRDNSPINPSTLTIVTQPTNGTIVVNPDRTVTYTPNNGYFGPDTAVYRVCADNGLCNNQDIRITVVENPFNPAVNQAPVATDDAVTTPSNAPITVPILTNDFDPDGDLTPTSTTITTQPTNGTATISPTGQLIYTPNPTFVGTDTITYQVVDDEGATDTAVVTVTVTAPDAQPQPPLAIDDTSSTAQDTPVTVDVLINDTDPDNNINPSSLTITTPPSNGTVSINSQNKVIYTPNAGYNGTDSFGYTITDSTNLSDSANVTITVTPSPVPVATDDVSTTQKDSPVTINVLNNDTSPDSPLNPSSVTIITQPTNGTVSINASGSVIYTPNDGFTGTDTFTYRVSNSLPNPQSDTALVSIQVTPDQSPLAVNDTSTTQKNISVQIPVLDNDIIPGRNTTPSDFDSFVVQPTNGTVSYDSTTGKVTYIPNTNYTGTDSFTYKIETSNGSSIATVLIDVQSPTGPNAINDTITINKGSTVDIPVLTNDIAGTGTLDTSTLTIESQPSNGVITVNPDGTINYTPNAGFVGTDSFVYEIGNSAGEFDTATVLITVANNVPPDAIDDSATTTPNSQITIPVLDNDFDSLDTLDPSSVTIESQPINGTVTINPDGSITYTPKTGFEGDDSFIYSVKNATGQKDVATVRVKVKSPTPQQRTGQVLGANSKTNLARTGGLSESAGNIMILGGFLICAGFFVSLYFTKSSQLTK